MSEYNYLKLKEHILELSKSTNFEQAIGEWDLESVEITDEFDNCPCGQQIKEHCYIRNKLNGNNTYVGNRCIKKFLNKDTGTLFDGLKRIKKDISANANEAVIEYANERGYLFDKEYQFLLDTMRKRSLSQKQLDWKKRINNRILNEVVVSHRINK